jgi:hypothetical protein
VGFNIVVASGSWKFRDNHLYRALKAAKKAGFCVEKTVISANGEIALVFGNGEPADTTNDNITPNEWDVVYAPHKKRTA